MERAWIEGRPVALEAAIAEGRVQELERLRLAPRRKHVAKSQRPGVVDQRHRGPGITGGARAKAQRRPCIPGLLLHGG